MDLVNVCRDITDPFYRYKMPALSTKILGRETVVTNLEQVAKALDRSPDVIMKYFSVMSGCGMNGNKLMGGYEAGYLQQILQHFIERYVICESCNNPETYLSARSDNIRKVCKACGSHKPVRSDLTMKRYIMRKQQASLSK